MKYYFIDRKTPIKIFDDLKFLNDYECGTKFSIEFSKQEIYCLQLACVSEADGEIDAVKVFGKGKFICINTEGTDYMGNKFSLTPKIQKNLIKPLFIMLDYTDTNLKSDKITIEICANNQIDKIVVDVKLTDDFVENNGFNDIKKLSRLVWLNSDKAIDNTIPKPFTAIKNDGLVFEILGRKIIFGQNAMPQKIESFFDEAVNLSAEKQCDLLEEAILFEIDNAEFKIKDIQNNKNFAIITADGISENFIIRIKTILKYEGSMEFDAVVKAKKDITIENILFSYRLTDYAARYMNGFSKKGGRLEDFTDCFKKGKQHDSLFCGNVNTGIRVKFKAENYIKPLCNIYYHNRELVIPEETWDNHGKGRIKTEGTKISFDTGAYSMSEGETRDFKGEIHITPFKAIDYKKHFETRYYHDEHLKDTDADIEEAARLGFNYINYHHGTPVNPYINYPFVENKALKNAVDKAKEHRINTKVYYTIRECSNHMAEVFAYKALGNEIIIQEKGDGATWQGGDLTPWIKKYFGENVIPAWKVHFDPEIYKSDDDAAMIVSPESRLENYYIEGLDWLLKNIGIKGIYIDDTALDRKALERARKVLEPYDGLIDMHTWNHHNDWAGDTSSIILYTEILPFIDSMWIGEDFDMSKSSADFIMTEMSAIPFGLTSQMLGGAKNLYVGLLYAMNFRYKWSDYTYEMYRLWNNFKIEESKMFGYWHSKNPVKTGNENVKCTTYLKNNTAMLCIYNFSEEKEYINLNINEELLGFKCSDLLRMPEIVGYQQEGDVLLSERIETNARGGIVLYVEGKRRN